jgi:hypothetical protein
MRSPVAERMLARMPEATKQKVDAWADELIKQNRMNKQKPKHYEIDLIALAADHGFDPYQTHILKYLFRAGKKAGESYEDDMGKVAEVAAMAVKYREGKAGQVPDKQPDKVNPTRVFSGSGFIKPFTVSCTGKDCACQSCNAPVELGQFRAKGCDCKSCTCSTSSNN